MQRAEMESMVRSEGQRRGGLPDVDALEVVGVVAMVNRILRNQVPTELRSARELFELCHTLDKLEIPESLRAQLTEARTTIGSNILETLYAEASSHLGRGQTDKARELGQERDLARLTWGLIRTVREELAGVETFTPTWVETKDSRTHRLICGLIRNKSTGVFEWERVKDLLPKDLRDRFVIDSLTPTEEKVANHIEEYADIAKKLGPEVLAQFLISIQKAGNLEFDQVLRIIAKHLGRCNIDTFALQDFKDLPDAVIQLTGVRDVVFLHLRNFLYRHLLETVPDTATASDYGKVLTSIGTQAAQILDVGRPTHRELFGALVTYFKDVLAAPTPERLVDGVTGKDGVRRPFPSLRQRIAMKAMKDGHRNLVSFFMGTGKTGTAFLSKEHVSAKKMLYICPNNLVQQTQERVSKYYKTGSVPTIGVIGANTKHTDIEAIMKSEIVILPYSMFKSSRAGKPITEHIKEAGFDFVTIDEAHLAKNDAGLNAEVIFGFVNEIPDLYEKGYILSMSGEPIPNTPNDIITQLRIHDRDTYGGMTTLAQCLKKVDPLVLRNALLDYMILIDPPEDWESYVKYEGYDLYPEERGIYQAIWGNDSLNPAQKLTALSLSILNPSLFATKAVESSLLDQCSDKTKDYLATYDCVLIAENRFKEGVMRTHTDAPDTPTFVEKLTAKLGPDVEISIIDGDTPVEDRLRIIEASKEKDGRKRVIVAHSSIVREGLDFSHIHRGIILEPDFNRPHLSQLVKRFQREGNTDAELTCYIAHDSVQQGIDEHSKMKYELGHRFKYGGTLTEEEARYFEDKKSDLDDTIQINNRKLTIGTAIIDKLLTNRHKLHRALAYLHGGGAERCKEFVAYAGKEFADWYSENWMRSYSGNNGRFVAGLAQLLEKDGVIEAKDSSKGVVYGDVACGPLVLENTLGAHGDRQRTICSYDLNPYQLAAGLALYKETRGTEATDPAIMGVSAMHQLKGLAGLDVLNCSLALHYTKLNLNSHTQNDERIKTLLEFNRVLRPGGLMILTLPSNVGTKDERIHFAEQLAHLGFEALPNYTGVGESTDDEERIFQNYTLVCRKTGAPKIEMVDMKHLKLSRMKTTRTGAGAEKAKEKLVDVGAVHTNFRLKGLSLSYEDGAGEVRETVKTHVERVNKARALLQRLYAENNGTFNKLPPAIANQITAGKIVLTRLAVTEERTNWIFSFEDSSEPAEFIFKD